MPKRKKRKQSAKARLGGRGRVSAHGGGVLETDRVVEVGHTAHRSLVRAGMGSADPKRTWAGTITPLEEGSYFCAYASLLHQKDMLEDEVRMDAYHDAILGNADNFKDKVVLDVGCGTGVLALFAAKAGARKVYAVEATRAADFARILVKGNKVEDVITVIQSTVEEVELPEKVDVIVSEFLGGRE